MSLGLLNNAITGFDAADIDDFGYAITVYREGATVDDPNTLMPTDSTGRVKIPVLNTGGIRPGDTVDVSGDFTGEEYLVMSVAETGPNTDDGVTQLVNSYIEIDLGTDTVADTSLADGVRMTPVNDLAEIFGAASGGPAEDNPFTIPDADNGVFALYVESDGKLYDVSATKAAATTYTSFGASFTPVVEPGIDSALAEGASSQVQLAANGDEYVIATLPFTSGGVKLAVISAHAPCLIAPTGNTDSCRVEGRLYLDNVLIDKCMFGVGPGSIGNNACKILGQIDTVRPTSTVAAGAHTIEFRASLQIAAGSPDAFYNGDIATGKLSVVFLA